MFAEKVSVSASVNIINLNFNKGPSTKDVRQLGRGGGFEISDIPGRGEGGGGL